MALLTLVLLSALLWAGSGTHPIASASPATLQPGAAAALPASPHSSHPDDGTTPSDCLITAIAPTPTATPTLAPSVLPTLTPSPTPTARPTITATPPPNGTPIPSATSCLATITPATAVNALGMSHTFTFSCGYATSQFPAPGSGPFGGCYAVSATVTDLTTGTITAIQAATCGLVAAAATSNGVQCASVNNPLCAAGFAPSGPGGQCAPCPLGFTFSFDGLCHIAPSAGICPPGTTPVPPTGPPTDCTEPPLPPVATATNQLAITINPGAPHVYRVDVTANVARSPGGGCPAGTTPVPSIAINTSGTLAPGCAFALSATKTYVEGTSLSVIPLGSCDQTQSTGITGEFGGTPCFFLVEALGIVVLKTGVTCGNGSEPANGTSAVPAGFVAFPGLLDYPQTAYTPVYDCTGGSLEVKNVGVPNIPINLEAENAVFGNNCVPVSQAPSLLTPTATASPGATATMTPSPTPTLTATFGPTPTLGPSPPSTFGPAFCLPIGSSTSQVVTDKPYGIAIFTGFQAKFFGNPLYPNVPHAPDASGNTLDETIFGHFLVDGVGLQGVAMFTTVNFQSGIPDKCQPNPAFTDSTGTANCTVSTVELAPPVVPVTLDFIYNCRDYTTTTYFDIGGPPPTPPPGVVGTAPAPNGICVVPTGFGPVYVTASFASTINTQPPLSSGPVLLGAVTAATPSPTETGTTAPQTATPSPTNTFLSIVTPTNTTVPTPTETPTNTPTATATEIPTPTPTRIPTLRFSLDAARVAEVHNPGNKKGLDTVRPGQTVWLMLYYTVRSVPKAVTRITTYQIRRAHTIIYTVSFKGRVTRADVGRSIRYTAVALPRTLPFGVYDYTGHLTLGNKTKLASWRFAVLKGAAIAFSTKDVLVKSGATSSGPP